MMKDDDDFSRHTFPARWWNKFLEQVWNLLPDKCENVHCKGHGMRGNENRVKMGEKVVVLCDDCSSMYAKDTEGKEA